MTQFRHYAKAPITEAVIDIRYSLPPGIRLDDIAVAFSSEQESYKQQGKIFAGSGVMRIGHESTVTTTTPGETIGYRYVSMDEKNICQLHKNGFIFSRLMPYQSWDSFTGEAKRLWHLLRERLPIAQIQRTSVRYVNRIDIPFESDMPLELSNYVRTRLEVPSDAQWKVLNFFMQMTISLDDIKSVAVIRQARIPPPDPNKMSLILDIEVARSQDVPQSDVDIWHIFDKLRESKNDIFERSITDAARRLFE